MLDMRETPLASTVDQSGKRFLIPQAAFSCCLLRSRVLKFLVIVSFFSVMGLEVTAADKATDDFNLGLGFYRAKRWDQAEETLGLFLREFPDHPRANVARLYLARSLSVLEKYEEARVEFGRFIKDSPESKELADARYRLGECSYFLKDYPAAVSQLKEYLAKHTEHTLTDWARLLLGDSYVSVKQYEQAVEVLSPLPKNLSDPSIIADARFSLGKALEGLKRFPEAIEQYRMVVSQKDATPAPRALNRIASIQYASGQYADAAASFEQVLAQYPTSSLVGSATLGAGMSWYRAANYEKALEWLKKVPAESSGRAQAILMTAMSLKELGRIEESRQVLTDALKAAGDSPFAADVLFQQGQMERTAGSKETAAQIFEDISDRWPKFARRDECLFNASELRLEINQREHAERIWNRLKEEFPETSARPREQILLGRLYLVRGDVEKSIETLQKAVEASGELKDRVTAVGRYYFIRALYEGKQHDRVVLQTTQMAHFLEGDQFSEVRGALALAAISSLELKQYQDVVRFAETFLLKATDDQQKSDVRAVRAVAYCHLKRYADALKELTDLAGSRPDDAQVWTAVLKAAEAALEQDDYKEAVSFFALAATSEKDPEVKEAGLTGIAWSQFESGDFAAAEKSFASLVAEYPSSEDLPQSRFMVARAIEEQADAERTAAAYSEVFATLTKDQPPAAEGAETQIPDRYAFDAGRQAARSLEKLKQYEEADVAWGKLVKQFPKARDLDRILDEWAWMNVTAKRFSRSDEIHRQLLDQFPESSFAGQARLSLAESSLEADKLEEALKEMQAINAEDRYGAAEKERALFHVVEIQAALQQWQPMLESAKQFLASYPESPLASQVRLFSGNALLETQKLVEASEVLNSLRDDIVAGKVPVQDWTDRVWIVLGEIAFSAGSYEQIDGLEKELLERSPKSVFAFQMMDIQGRRWKQQAPPDFAKAREYFLRVTSDPDGQGTQTAARCQFLIAETLVLEMKLEDAVKEYFKVYVNYSHDELRAQALFQAASCEVQLNKTESALRDFRELIATFPESSLVKASEEAIKKLTVSTETKE